MDKPKKCISPEHAQSLQKQWRSSRSKAVNRALGYEDTSDFWYSLEELQEYLDYVREKSKEQGVSNPGIRIFLGAYPEEEKKKSYSTIFLMATKESTTDNQNEDVEGENNYEIDPFNHSNGGIPPTEL